MDSDGVWLFGQQDILVVIFLIKFNRESFDMLIRADRTA